MGYDRGRKGQHHSARRERPGRGRWWCTAATHLQLEESREEVLAKLAEGLVLHLEAREDVLRGGFNGIRERGGELLLRSCVVGALFAAPSAPHPAAAPSNLTTRDVALSAQVKTSHTGTLATSQFARRAGLFARFEEQFSQMTRAITKICMQIVVTSDHRILFAISREKMTRPKGIEFLVQNTFSTPSSPTAPRAPS